MSRVDTAWLRMDNEVNLMMIVGVWLLAPAVPLARLRATVAERLLRYHRFRQKAVPDALGAEWVDDDSFDIARHVVAEPLKPRGGRRATPAAMQAALQARCGELASTPLDPARPLWQFHLVERYPGGSAIILRIHHCIADGIALIAVMNAITDGGGSAVPSAEAAEPHEHEHDGIADMLLRALPNASSDWVRGGLQLAGDLAALAWMPDDSPTRLKGRPGGHKRVAWGEPLPLEAVKVVGKALNCSVNDVLLACVTGAIGHWLRAQSKGDADALAGQEIRAMVPVNLRPLDEAWQLGNRFGLAPLLLPVGLTNPIERVYAVHARMAALKHSTQPLLSFAVLAVAGLVTKPMQDALLGLFARKSTAVMTNVPGPREPLHFCGATLRQSLFWVPASGDIGVGVSILSYAGGVQFGLITDAALCPDPQAIIDRFEPEFQQLLLLALMLPWGEAAAGG